MPRAKRPQSQIFTTKGFWLVVAGVFVTAFLVALILNR
jgi:hypothetical protein